MNLNAIAANHYDWVERMGWHNKTILEAQALIASEIGEAADEALHRISRHPHNLGEELADIILRIADLSITTKFNLQELVDNSKFKWRSTTNLEDFCELMTDMGRWINSARKDVINEDFGIFMGQIVKRVIHMAESINIDLEQEIMKKIGLNEIRGTRGRRI